MKRFNEINIALLLIMASTLSSCAAIGGIFKAGVNVGLFIAIAIVLLLIVVIVKIVKK